MYLPRHNFIQFKLFAVLYSLYVSPYTIILTILMQWVVLDNENDAIISWHAVPFIRTP